MALNSNEARMSTPPISITGPKEEMSTQLIPNVTSSSSTKEEADKANPHEASTESKRSIWATIYSAGYSGKKIGPRIAPVLPHLRKGSDLESSDGGSEADNASDILQSQLDMEMDNALQYRTCSWQKTAALLAAEYICLAIMSFPYSYSVLGLVPGIILTVFVALLVLYTSLVLWEFCLRHPEVRDVCDIGQMLFGGSKWVWWATSIMFLLNNTFIQALHILTLSTYLNTAFGHHFCTVGYAAIAAIICFGCSLPRTFDSLSTVATYSAMLTFISVMLACIFAGIEAHPNRYNTGGLLVGEPLVYAFPGPGVTFVSGLTAFLNISYTFIGQITLPSFIAEMKNPRDFPKALWSVTIFEIILFSTVGGVIYAYTGTQYNTAPAFGSLASHTQKVISFSFMLPTLIFLGVLYASVSARFLMFRIFGDGSRHKASHTFTGWATWTGILAATWVFAFLIAEVIPFFSDLLSLMSSLFDSFFGFIFWGVAYLRMRRVDSGGGEWLWVGGKWAKFFLVLNFSIIAVGIFFFGPGTYVSVKGILDSYAAGTVKGVFSCANNAI